MRRSFIGLTIICILSPCILPLSAQVFPPVRLGFSGFGDINFEYFTSDKTYRNLLSLKSATESSSKLLLLIDGQAVNLQEISNKSDSEDSETLLKGAWYSFDQGLLQIYYRDSPGQWFPVYFAVSNNSKQSHRYQLKILFDPYNSQLASHYSLIQNEGSQALDGEAEIVSQNPLKILEFLRGPEVQLPHFSLALFSDGSDHFTKRTLLANQKRLWEDTSEYVYQKGRSFSYLPFSINDSALMSEFEEQILLPGQKKIFCLSWGINTDLEQALNLKSLINEDLQILEKKVSTAPVEEKSQKTADPDLEELDAVLKELENLQGNNGKQADLERLMQKILDLQNKP